MRDLALFVGFVLAYQVAVNYAVEGAWKAFNAVMRTIREDWPE